MIYTEKQAVISKGGKLATNKRNDTYPFGIVVAHEKKVTNKVAKTPNYHVSAMFLLKLKHRILIISTLHTP